MYAEQVRQDDQTRVRTTPAVSRSDEPSRRRWRRPAFLPEGRRLSDEIWARRHRGLTWFLAAHVPALIIFGLVRGYPVLDVLIDMGALLVAIVFAALPWLSRKLRSSSTSIGLVIASSILVHLSGGSIEAHFQFFVVIAFLTLYQDWVPFLLALVYVVGEHGILGAIDPQAVYNNPADIAHPWRYAAIHGGFVLAASVANIMSWRLTEQEALRDNLTGLPNRAYLLDALAKTLAGSGRSNTTVLFIDLDNFKDANDAFGHHVGDAYLQALAKRLKGQLRAGDVLARLGGDEFAIVLTERRDEALAAKAAARMLAAIQQPVRVCDITFQGDASIGMAFADDDRMAAAELLRNADLAMYEAKHNGGGRVARYRSELHTAVVRRTALEVELRAALERDELVLHYQPLVDLGTQNLLGAEALIRWQHPVRGLLAPAEFIPLAEHSSVIISLGAWVIRTACRQTAAWQRANPDRAPIGVSVNIAPQQLLDRTLVATVASALDESGLEPQWLCLEITEGSIIKDIDVVMPTLTALHDLGVSLALDDFGTGYSSLSYLRQLPVDTVKIDRSFVSALDEAGPNAQIVLAIIDLAHALGLNVTAEGIETGAQLSMLRDLGSDRAQGYFLGKPMAPAVFEAFLDRREQIGTPLPTQRTEVDDALASISRLGVA
jgi:diguanylate cyclase (GGDEF)-like protein